MTSEQAADAVATPVHVGIDLGGTKCLAVALAGGQTVAQQKVPTRMGAEGILAMLAELIPAVGQMASGRLGCPTAVATVGVGAPGLVDRGGVVRVAPNLPGAAGLALGPELSRRLGVPVVVDNDATCAAWGERQMGAGQGLSEMVLVTLGTGIGGGLVVEGRVARGSNGFAGEVGHMIVDPHGPPCPCGQQGCWERFASGSGLAHLARKAVDAGRATRVLALAGGDETAVRGEHVTLALAEGDAEAAAIMAELAWWVALGLSNLANIFDPEAFVLGGGLVEIGDPLLAPARAEFTRRQNAMGRQPVVPIRPAALGEAAGALGAAWLGSESG